MRPLNDIIVSYPTWERPWGFDQWVIDAIGTNEADRTLFEAARSEAGHARHWTEGDLAQCARRAEMAVRARFPELSDDAARAIVNAAAYQWR